MYRLSKNELFCWVVKVFFIFSIKKQNFERFLIFIFIFSKPLAILCKSSQQRPQRLLQSIKFFFGLTKALIKKAKFPYGNNRISQIISLSTLYRFIRFQYIYILRSIPIIIQKVTHLFKHGTLINKHPTIQAQASIIQNVYQNSKYD